MILDKRQHNRMYKYSLMFGFGITFMILMVIQNIFLPSWLFLIVEFLELCGVYYIMKNFVKKEMEGK